MQMTIAVLLIPLQCNQLLRPTTQITIPESEEDKTSTSTSQEITSILEPVPVMLHKLLKTKTHGHSQKIFSVFLKNRHMERVFIFNV